MLPPLEPCVTCFERGSLVPNPDVRRRDAYLPLSRSTRRRMCSKRCATPRSLAEKVRMIRTGEYRRPDRGREAPRQK
jgi:hypothetical protein